MKRIAVALLIAAPAHAQSYEPALVTPELQGSPNTMTPLYLGDDNTRKIDLGFDFTYWGQTFSSAWVGSNGTVSFSTSANLCCSGMSMESAPRNTIYAFWTDLISYSGNPYYKRNNTSILFGWYGTSEYGTNNQYSFEVNLSDDNAIQINYGKMPALSYHYAAAGITGPDWGDNIQLFYGRDPRPMQYQSGRLVWSEPAPVATLDCSVTPMDPACPPVIVSPVPTVTVTAEPIETIHDAAAADQAADVSDTAAATMSEPEQEIDITPAAEPAASITEQVATAIAATPAAEPERLTPDQLMPQQASSDKAEEAAPQATFASDMLVASSATFSAAFASFGPAQAASSVATASPAMESVAASSSPSSPANVLEALNMSSAMPVAAAPASMGDTQQGGMADGQAAVMAEMASSPAFSAYTSVALQDRPDFYAPRDIYKNRRLRDANFEMYVMTQRNKGRWQEMVDEQYGR